MRFLAAFSALLLWIGAYLFVIRPGLLRWGATAGEFETPLPGDGLVSHPAMSATRSITIAATPERIWPWIVQIGYDRAGFYGYDLIENLGSRTGIPSARAIIPELQRTAVGDKVFMSRIAYLRIAALEPSRYLIWSDERPPYGAFTFALFPVDPHHTRLVVRTHLRYHWTDRRILLDLFTEFGDHVAVPRMLMGIRDRAEGRAIEPLWKQAIEIAIWLSAMLAFGSALLLTACRRRWWKPWLVAMAAGAMLLFVLYARQPVWIGAVLQAPMWMILRWAAA